MEFTRYARVGEPQVRDHATVKRDAQVLPDKVIAALTTATTAIDSSTDTGRVRRRSSTLQTIDAMRDEVVVAADSRLSAVGRRREQSGRVGPVALDDLDRGVPRAQRRNDDVARLLVDDRPAA